MDEERKTGLHNLLYGAVTVIYSFMTDAAAYLYLYFQTSPTEEVSRQVIIGGVAVFVALTLMGAFGFGRFWRTAPAVVGTAAAFPSILICLLSNFNFLSLCVAFASFVSYYGARRWFGNTLVPAS